MRSTAIVLVGISIATAAWGQQTEPKPPFPIHEVKLQKQVKLAPTGSVAVYEGTVDEIGLGYRISNTSMMMPVSVTVTSLSELGVKVAIGKTWTEADRSLDTSQEGTVTARYRTDDVSQIKIAAASKGTARFVMMIWVGDEQTDYPDVTSPLDWGQRERARGPGGGNSTGSASAPTAPQPGSGSAAPLTPTPTPAPKPEPASSGGTSPVLWVIAGLLGVLVVVALIALRRRKS